jgi:hypothetical protein
MLPTHPDESKKEVSRNRAIRHPQGWLFSFNLSGSIENLCMEKTPVLTPEGLIFIARIG